MAFRIASLAKHARSVTGQLKRTHAPQRQLRRFTSTPIYCAKTQQNLPLDSLVADAIQTENELDAKPAEKKPARARPPVSPLPPYTGGMELPSVDLWSRYYPWNYELMYRATTADPGFAKQLAEAYVPEGSKDKVIIEAFAGPGQLTRALLALPKERIKKIICLENWGPWYEHLKTLEAIDPRITTLQLDGFYWSAYEAIETAGHLDGIKKTDWSEEHSQLMYIGHIPHKVHGEQLVSQFFRSIPEQQFIFKYGRVPMRLIMNDTLWKRIHSGPGTQVRCKLGVIAESTAAVDLAVPVEDMSATRVNFWPRNERIPDKFASVSIEPLKDQLIAPNQLDDWDYCLRRLFVQKASPIKTCVSLLAPGAGSLLKKFDVPGLPTGQRVDQKKSPRQLTALQWKTICETFADWPFKPEDLSIDSFHMTSTKADSRRVIGKK